MTSTGQAPFPKLDSPMVELGGYISIPWYKTLVDLWTKTGGANSQSQNAAFIQQSPTNAGAPLTVNSSSTGDAIGTLQLQNLPGQPAEVQELGLSPFEFIAPVDGQLLLGSGAWTFSRDGGATWYAGGLVGGMVRMKIDDAVTVTWFGAEAPGVTWFPDFVVGTG